ncbi:MAG: sugar ABC transporter permease [Anaerolineae bacterium]|nr:sugar ABC transporter permease [Anaerolineae bacterium]MDH7472695.1 sugar ABC transporter permease [Anaerolineae bacterium]
MFGGELRSQCNVLALESTGRYPVPLKSVKNWWLSWGRETCTAYLFLLPSFLVFAVFTFLPVIFSLVISLFRWNLPRQPVYIGLDNFKWLFTDPIDAPAFHQSVINSFYYALGGIPLNMAISLGLALLLNRRLRGVELFRTMYFLPTITSTVAVSVVWMWIYHPADYGLLNGLLLRLGLPPQSWLRDPRLAMPALIAMGIWKGMGYNVIIFLAGLQNIPAHLYEAAEIDGAGEFAKFRKITWPLLGPTTFYILVISVINSLKAFAQIHVMTQGGPLGRTTTIVYYLYQQGFETFRMGKASAVAVVLFALLLVLTFIQFKAVGSRVYYYD